MKRACSLILLFGFLITACTPAAGKTAAPTEGQTPTTQPPATNTLIPTDTVAPTDAAAPTDTAIPPTSAPSPSVFVISWDGGQAEMIYNLIETGKLPHFAEVAAAGIRAEYARSVDPTMTASAQNSISSGSYPAHTGIVSNSYHNPTDSIFWYRRGLDARLDRAEPVWVTASRAGLTTAAVFFTGGAPENPGQTADYTIGYGIRDAGSLQETISLVPAAESWQGDLPASFSPPYEGNFTIREVSSIYLYVLDSSDDGQNNYDSVILSTERSISTNSPHLKIGQWGQMLLMPKITAGGDFLIQEIQQDGVPSKVKLFYSGVYHNSASPRELLEGLNEKFGYFPSGHDPYAIENGWITPEQDLYLAERAALWMAAVAAWVNTTYQPDLLFTWQNIIDGAGHSFLLEDERQFNYSPENVEIYAGYYDRCVQLADQALEVMLASIDLRRSTLMMVSDHGMAPIHSRVYVNTILQQAGLLRLDSRDYVIAHKSRAMAFASGGSAHIYINLEDHEKDGFVSAAEYAQIQAQIVDLFSGLSDPHSGEPVFQRVLRQDELGDLHLDHLNAGDIFVQAYPGYHLDHWRGVNFIFEPVNFLGQHGYDSSLPEMYAMFIAAGLGAPPGGGVIPPVRVVDYAPTIAALLGFAPAPTVDGELIPALAP